LQRLRTVALRNLSLTAAEPYPQSAAVWRFISRLSRNGQFDVSSGPRSGQNTQLSANSLSTFLHSRQAEVSLTPEALHIGVKSAPVVAYQQSKAFALVVK